MTSPGAGILSKLAPGHPACRPATRRTLASRSGLRLTLNLAPMIDVTFLLLIFFIWLQYCCNLHQYVFDEWKMNLYIQQKSPTHPGPNWSAPTPIYRCGGFALPGVGLWIAGFNYTQR